MKKIVSTLLLFIVGATSLAYAKIDITEVPVEERNDFILDPAKMEFSLDPGETAERTIFITSRIADKTSFSIEVEDFVGSRDPLTPVVLLGKDKSPYSFKDNIDYPDEKFELDFGEKAAIPIKIKIPENASPGGYYATVIITNAPSKEKSKATGARTVSRVGSLLFVRVKGNVKEEGGLKDFRVSGETGKWFLSEAPRNFELVFSNDGNVHLVPRGDISVKNIFGRVVDSVKIDPFFTLPQSLRSREITWSGSALLGRYTATISLNRGYSDLIDTKSVVFWVIPWKFILIVFGIVFALVFIFKYLSKNFEFRRK